MKRSMFLEIPCFKIMLTFALLASATASSQAQTQPCPETNGVKVLFPPQTSYGGLDVKDSRQSIVLADDFPCTSGGKITDIHLWGSWLNNVHGTITNFWIGIYDDVPASTGNTNSHPGTNLLWQQSFPAGQFYETEVYFPNPYEYFYNPASGSLDLETNVWYYCFYPTNPFVQQGSLNQPTNYWLAVRAQLLPGDGTYYGWKTSISNYNDAAVWDTVGADDLPKGNWISMMNPVTASPVNLSFKLTTDTNQPPCVETNGVKYVQLPNLDGGLDVWNNPYVLADDFICTNTGPITDIHIWGSWNNNLVAPRTLTFWLAIYDDVPVSATNSFSHPGNQIWQQWFGPDQYAENPDGTGFEYFLDPGPPAIIGQDSQAWYYCFYPTNPPIQTGTNTAPKTYWLAVYAQEPNGSTNKFGWKTTASVRNDVSVHANWPGIPPTNNPGWTPTFQPPTGPPLDLAFKITTPPPQPVVCVESDYEKYVQGPNIIGGYDVWNNPYVLADDFVCTTRGPISDIHLWGSWLYDQALTNTITFWLGIYDDVKVGPGNAFSHPGTNLLWQQWFSPGQYAETIWTANAQEFFLDPGPTNIMGQDFTVWYYCFYPTNAFQQLGTPTNSKTYWLAAYAQLPSGTQYYYGWKTTTNYQHDVSVHAPWPGVAPTNNPGWTPTAYQPPTGGPSVSLDLAFKLTMCGPVFINRLAPTNVVVTWPGGGYLQSATNVTGPYIDVPGFPPSPYTDSTVIPPTNRFYRLRCY